MVWLVLAIMTTRVKPPQQLRLGTRMDVFMSLTGFAEMHVYIDQTRATTRPVASRTSCPAHIVGVLSDLYYIANARIRRQASLAQDPLRDHFNDNCILLYSQKSTCDSNKRSPSYGWRVYPQQPLDRWSPSRLVWGDLIIRAPLKFLHCTRQFSLKICCHLEHSWRSQIWSKLGK